MPIAESASASAAKTPSSTPVKRGVDSVAPTTSAIVRTSAIGRVGIELTNLLLDRRDERRADRPTS